VPASRHPRATLFLRAEDVFGFTLRVRRDIEGLGEVEDELRGALREGSLGQRLATGAAAGQRAALIRRYGADPDARSHGETFLHLLQQRLQPRGLYFLDEPRPRSRRSACWRCSRSCATARPRIASSSSPPTRRS